MSSERRLNNQHQDSLTAKEAAALLGVRTATVYAYASRGLLGSSGRGPGKPALYARDAVETLRLKAAARGGHAAVAAAALRWGEPVLDSSITRISPRGPVYRQQRAIDLIRTPFEDVASLLWRNQADWTQRVARVDTNAPRPSIHALLEVVAHHAAALATTPWTCAPALIHRLACAAGTHEALAEPHRCIADALSVSLLGRKLSPKRRMWLNAALVLLADHELNASTFAARVAASAGAPWIDCIVSALGTAAGIRHAAACDRAERLWQEVLAASNVNAWIRNQRQRQLEGFEVGAYPAGDPRAQRLLDLMSPSLPPRVRSRLTDFVEAVDTETGQLPAIDFALAVMSAQLGLPNGSSTLVFVIARTAGWVAHIVEQTASPSFIRPRARYVQRD
jgi:citrate synthase